LLHKNASFKHPASAALSFHFASLMKAKSGPDRSGILFVFVREVIGKVG
jgi:hypothetical protein